MSSHLPPWKSETRAVVMGAPIEFFDFVPLLGPNGGRCVVDRFQIVVTGTITVAVANWDGRDQWRIAQLINVEDRAGKLRWSLSGYKSRAATIKYDGLEAMIPSPDLAIAAGAVVDIRLTIPMTKRKLRRGKDFALPADCFKKVSITWAALASAVGGGTVLTVPALNAYVLAEWHEETSVEFKAEDIVRSTDFNSNTECKLAPNGVVHDLDIVLEGTTLGGNVITAITDVRCEDIGLPLLTRLDLVGYYRTQRELGVNNYGAAAAAIPNNGIIGDWVFDGKQLPVITSGKETSVFDGKVAESMIIKVGTGIAGLACITREVTEKSQALYHSELARFSVNPASVKVKTEAKSRTGLTDGWNKRQQLVMPWKAPLPRTT